MAEPPLAPPTAAIDRPQVVASAGTAPSSARCALCGEGGDEGTVVSFGGVLSQVGPMLGPFQHNTYVHRLCALWSPEVYQEGNKMRNVMAAVRRGRSLRCSHCGEKGATVGCCVDWCTKNYHIRCAQKAGCEINAKQWILSCPQHSRKMRGAHGKAAVGPKRGGAPAHCLPCPPAVPLPRTPGVVRPLPPGFDVDEELWRRKQRRRIEQDVRSLAPRALGPRHAPPSTSSPSQPPSNPPSAADASAIFAEGWEMVGGHGDVIRQLKEAVLLPLMYRDEFARIALQCPRGILLHGEPGTGKTLVVRALAGACNRCAHIGGGRPIAFFSRKGADCLGKFHGEAERKLRLLFSEAERLAPSIIFFDELDGLAPVRGAKVSDQIHTSVVREGIRTTRPDARACAHAHMQRRRRRRRHCAGSRIAHSTSGGSHACDCASSHRSATINTPPFSLTFLPLISSLSLSLSLSFSVCVRDSFVLCV